MDSWRKIILFISMVVMLAGLLFSRAMLSTGLIFFAATCLIHKNIPGQVRTFLSSTFLWSMSLLFLLPLISGSWSEDIFQWLRVIRIKLPLLLLPICFAGANNFEFKNWERIAFTFLILVFGGIGWSLWQYLRNWESIHEGYLKAHTIETPLGNDHVRFSLLVAITILVAVFLFIKKRKDSKKIILIFLVIVTISNIIYLHVLAVRTGLICFYISLFAFFLSLLKNSQHKIKFVLLLILALILPLVSYFIFPTFKNRVNYLKYDLQFVRKNQYRQGSNDGNRFASVKAGWAVLNQHPLTGTGFGDIKKETEKFYDSNYPQMQSTDKILPSSEWMMYGSGVGWPGFILFSFIMLVPFFIKQLIKNMTWWMLNIFMASGYLFDIGLEVQYGVFMHAFILLWWYKWLQTQE